MISDNNKLISIVIPVYGCDSTLSNLVTRVNDVFNKLSYQYEIIFVDDISNCSTWDVITALCNNNERVKGVKLSRNFGQHYAITCGLKFATGEWVVVMDCDLQDQPEEIIKLIEKTNEGYDIVLAKRALRQDNFVKN